MPFPDSDHPLALAKWPSHYKRYHLPYFSVICHGDSTLHPQLPPSPYYFSCQLFTAGSGCNTNASLYKVIENTKTFQNDKNKQNRHFL